MRLVGRTRELSLIATTLADAKAGKGRTLILSGEGGVGKTRLLTTGAEQAQKDGWKVVVGRSYEVETGIPYALFSDAMLPMLRTLEPSTLSVLTRGGLPELGYLFPALVAPGDRERAGGGVDPADFKARLLWNFTQFLGRLATRQPLCIILENLQWADASSLELLHFVARQIADKPIVLLASYNETERDVNPTLRATEQSLVGLGVAATCRLSPLSAPDVEELLLERFPSSGSALRKFAAVLYGWTRGNPFFIEETIKSLLTSGTLHQEKDQWIGWEVDSLYLPPTVSDAIATRLEKLSDNAARIAGIAAVMGSRSSYDQLSALTSLDPEGMASSLDELCGQRILEEVDAESGGSYDFSHPMIQRVTYDSLGAARARLLHGEIAEALEKFYGRNAGRHAGELALHFTRSGTRAPKAVLYLSEAGIKALDTYANREAAEFLTSALQQSENSESVSIDRYTIILNLARARQRLGEYDDALVLWRTALDAATATQDHASIAMIEFRMGLANFWSGHFDKALTHYADGLTAAGNGTDQAAIVRLHLAKATCLQELGRIEAAKAEVESALHAAETTGSSALLSRSHRTQSLLFAWTGPVSVALEHGEKAIRFAEESGEQMLEWTAHWAMGLLAGLTGKNAEMVKHIGDCERLEGELRSPLLPLWTAELSLQHASWVGEWDAGLALGERTIAQARALRQATLLPRLLVWTGLIYLWRHDLATARAYFEEAWNLSGASTATEYRLDVPTVVPAHMGLAAYHLETSNYAEAIRIGEAGRELADNLGYIAWTLQWLLPVVGEAALWSADFKRAEQHSQRMRRDAERMTNPISLAFADACDGMLLIFRDSDADGAIPLLERAVAAMESIPLPDSASRTRRVLAGARRDVGDREGAIRELRIAHDVFARLGAAGELDNVRNELRQLGARPPARTVTEGMSGLTGRELEIARMVAMRKSNKEIGAALDISARTVSTHLSNIFSKVGVASRGELVDFVRDNLMPAD